MNFSHLFLVILVTLPFSLFSSEEPRTASALKLVASMSNASYSSEDEYASSSSTLTSPTPSRFQYSASVTMGSRNTTIFK